MTPPLIWLQYGRVGSKTGQNKYPEKVLFMFLNGGLPGRFVRLAILQVNRKIFMTDFRKKQGESPEENDALTRASSLIDAIQDPDLPDDLRDGIETWFRSDMNDAAKYEALTEAFGRHLRPNENPDEYEYSRFRELAALLGLTVDARKRPMRRRLSSRPFARIAAVLLPLAVVFGLAWFFGRGGADDGLLTYETRDSLRKVELADGTLVWINVDSRLTVYTSPDSLRLVTLEGEAFFDVAHDQSRPFVVSTDDMSVRVLGTQFNVKAYPEGDPEVILHQGRVEVTTPAGVAVLEPMEKITYERRGVKPHAEIVNVVYDWRSDAVIVNNMPLPDLFRHIGDYYGKQIDFAEHEFEGCGCFGVKFDGGTSAEEVLEALAKNSRMFAFTVADDSVFIKRK